MVNSCITTAQPHVVCFVLFSPHKYKSRGFASVSAKQESDGNVKLMSAGAVWAASLFASSCGISVHPADRGLGSSGAGFSCTAGTT